MNRQEIFDRVVVGLLNQGEPSYVAPDDEFEQNVRCAYRNDRGLCCAIGMLIDEAYYSTEYEENTVEDERVLEALKQSGIEIEGDDQAFLMSLQYAHDGIAENHHFFTQQGLTYNFEQEVKGHYLWVAKEFNLDPTVCLH